MTYFRLFASPITLSGAALLLSACAHKDTGRYPSLLPREIESRSDAEPEVVAAVAEPDQALDAKIATKTTAIVANKRDFVQAATRAESLVRRAKGDAVGGDRWIDAQSALAELDIIRAQSSSVVTDLEELALARAADGKPSYPALDVGLVAAHAELDAETTQIGTLQSTLPAA